MEPRPAGAGSTGISHPPSIADGKEEASKDKVERKKAAEKDDSYAWDYNAQGELEADYGDLGDGEMGDEGLGLDGDHERGDEPQGEKLDDASILSEPSYGSLLSSAWSSSIWDSNLRTSAERELARAELKRARDLSNERFREEWDRDRALSQERRDRERSRSRDIEQICELYIDDILHFSESQKEYLKSLEKIFMRVKDYNVFLNPKKCNFGLERVVYLGHVMDRLHY
jgi:hypothetical protein